MALLSDRARRLLKSAIGSPVVAKEIADDIDQSVKTDVVTSATGPVGTVVKKLAVYDSAGSLLGYIPIYNSIS